MSLGVISRELRKRELRPQWWWLIWGSAALCIFLCGFGLGIVSGGNGEGEGRWFGQILAPAFGGRDHVSILAVGVDHSEGRGLADTMIGGMVMPRTREIAALCIPRDSRVFVPGVGVRRVNEAHSFGGLPLTIETAELLLGMTFDYYVEVSIPSMVNLVDAIGGIDLEVEKRMYYRDRAQDLLIDLQPGRQHLDGAQAMGYVRFRHDASGDLGRIERQRRFLRVFANEVLAPERVRQMPKLAETFVETVSTNLTVRDLLALKKIVEEMGADAIRMGTLPGRPRLIEGRSMIELDAVEVQRAVDRVLWGRGVSVAVLNGTEVNGLAARTASFLEERGCEVLEVGNADRRSDTTVVIDHRGRSERAERVAGWLGCGVVSVDPDGEKAADVTVILGRDMVGREQ